MPVLARLDPALADTDLVPALAAAFPGFDFSRAPVDEDYWRDTRSVIRPDGTRVRELRPWMTAELAKDGGDLAAPQSERPADHRMAQHQRLRVRADRARRGRLHPDRARS